MMGRTAPRQVRALVWWAVAILMGAFGLGCTSTPPAGQLQTVTVPTLAEYPLARLEGELRSTVDEAAGLVHFVVVTEDGQRFGLLLPAGMSSAGDGSCIVEDGRCVATTGQRYHFGGGESPRAGDVWVGGPAVDVLWLTQPRSGWGSLP